MRTLRFISEPPRPLDWVLRLIARDSPADVEAAYTRSLYGNFTYHGPICIVAAIYLYAAAQPFTADSLLPGWMFWFVLYHALRTAVGLIYVRSRAEPSVRELRWWGLLSLLLHFCGGLLLLVLALAIYPTLEDASRNTLLMAVMVIVCTSAFNLAGRWAEILVYAPPVYLGFAWASWSLSYQYAKPVAILVLLLFGLYLFQARNQHRANLQSFSLARRNGELAAELQVKNAELQEVARARSRLLATVSHDLRQPSHAIGLLCERALIEPHPDVLKASLRDLNELSQSLSASLTTLMDLTRLDAGLVRPSLEPVPLGQVLHRLEAEFSALAKNRGLQLDVPPSSLWVESDPVLLHGILANLVSNAIRYTRAGAVRIELTLDGEQLSLAVRDTGIGIRPDKLELIFKEFVRLDASESGTEGLGLGLSIVRRYAALLGHRLEVHSEPDRGSCFALVLPVRQVNPQQVQVQAEARSPVPGDVRLVGLRVLVVDNVDLVLASMVRTLQAWGCEVHAAHSLAEATEIGQHHGLDIILSDFHLGDAQPDGLALIAKLRQLTAAAGRPLHALLMTGDVSSQLELQALQCGVGVLHKPVRPSVLHNRLLTFYASQAASLESWPLTGQPGPAAAESIVP